MIETERAWYAVQLRSNQERTTARFLADRGVEVFCPTYQTKNRRTDRSVILERPLFTGYLFARFAPGDTARVQVLKAPGSVRIVGFGGGLTPIEDEVIESLKILVGSDGTEVRPHPLVEVGKQVRVTDGPFCGAVGILLETSERRPRLVVQMEFLGRAVAVPVSPEQLAPR